MSSSDLALRVAILEYLRSGSVGDPSQMEVAVQVLGEALGVDIDSAEYKQNSLASKNLTLQSVFDAGVKALAPADLTAWTTFFDSLKSKGAFNGKTEGTDAYNAAVKHVAEKFIAKFPDAALPADVKALLTPSQAQGVNVEKAEAHKAEGNEFIKKKDFRVR